MRRAKVPVIYLLLTSLIILGYVTSSKPETKEVGAAPVETRKEPGEKVLAILTTEISARNVPPVSSEVIITNKGDDWLALVNKNVRLPAEYEPADLVVLDTSIKTTRGGMKLRSEAAAALGDMVEEARKNGVELIVSSAYRSYWQQLATFNYWSRLAGAGAESFSARPGHSQHQLGTAVDFTLGGSGFGEGFSRTNAGIWLERNAYKYGFVLSYPKGKEAITGYKYEPWHYRYIGAGNSVRMVASGLILEEFLQRHGIW